MQLRFSNRMPRCSVGRDARLESGSGRVNPMLQPSGNMQLGGFENPCLLHVCLQVHRSEGLIYMVLEYGDIDLARLLQVGGPHAALRVHWLHWDEIGE